MRITSQNLKKEVNEMLNACALYADLPETVKGTLVKQFDDNGGDDCYTVVLNSKLNLEQQQKAYKHELEHYEEEDFEIIGFTVDEIEWERHL